jgi:hypothetical protein
VEEVGAGHYSTLRCASSLVALRVIPSLPATAPPSPEKVSNDEDVGGGTTCDLYDGEWVRDGDEEARPLHAPGSCP